MPTRWRQPPAPHRSIGCAVVIRDLAPNKNRIETRTNDPEISAKGRRSCVARLWKACLMGGHQTTLMEEREERGVVPPRASNCSLTTLVHRGMPDGIAYSSTKLAIRGLTQDRRRRVHLRKQISAVSRAVLPTHSKYTPREPSPSSACRQIPPFYTRMSRRDVDHCVPLQECAA